MHAPDAVTELLARPETVAAMDRIDRIAFAIGSESHIYTNLGKALRRVGGVALGAAAIVLGGWVMEVFDGAAASGDGLPAEALHAVTVTDGVAAADQFGAAYGHDVQFGATWTFPEEDVTVSQPYTSQGKIYP